MSSDVYRSLNVGPTIKNAFRYSKKKKITLAVFDKAFRNFRSSMLFNRTLFGLLDFVTVAH